jgi:hypothetical protein
MCPCHHHVCHNHGQLQRPESSNELQLGDVSPSPFYARVRVSVWKFFNWIFDWLFIYTHVLVVPRHGLLLCTSSLTWIYAALQLNPLSFVALERNFRRSVRSLNALTR